MKVKEYEYLPRFYVPSENLIVEFKTEKAYEDEIDLNIAKMEACVHAGYNSILLIYEKGVCEQYWLKKMIDGKLKTERYVRAAPNNYYSFIYS